MELPLRPPIKPMLAKLARTMPSDDGLLFEPKWDGFRCIVFRDGDEIELTSRNQRPFNRYFPELLHVLLDALPDRCVVDGEIVVAHAEGKGLDFDALQQRIHPAASRVNMLAEQTPASFVAFDLLALGDENLVDAPFGRRRELLEEHLSPNAGVHLTPATTDPAIAERWFTRFEGAGLDGVMAKRLDGTYTPDKRTLVKVKHERTAECAVAGFRIHKDGEGVGSLLLGLYDDAGRLHHVGVCAAFTAAFRRELVDDLGPLTEDALDDHPWRDWVEAAAHSDQRMPGGFSRWNVDKDLSFVPVRIERVVEVTFGQLEGGRFRHGVKFQRWRPDRTPDSCRYEQLDVAAPVPFDELLAETGSG
ncbi:MAG: ATP-dependent DNA ligase [Ilumatobacter sp.]|uniref:ATP-dependent DNA ligase n=1 Tax=Ilumatobacter sp. TaxID=1967498 RepID=UPI002625EFDD|nr:ATP-dependent DNA ligase [Ilumatobacter sp.]MDJ0767237.1 ATP-dependent DNA ligase [Ilumatobacter sp.]